MEMPYEDKLLLDEKSNDNSDIDELIVAYNFKCCGCPNIFFTVMIIITFPFVFFCYYCNAPYKKVVIIDKKNKTLIVCSKGMIPCCKLAPRTFRFEIIKKIRIYISSKPDPNVGFEKLYFINCEIYSVNDEKEDLFIDVKYD